jgi:hypothetical protein
MHHAIAIVGLCVVSPAFGCDQGPFHADRHVHGAKLLAIGYVTGDVRPEPETHLLGGGKREARTAIEQRHVRITPVEVILGRAEEPLVVPVHCNQDFPAVEERVVYGITGEGWSWVYPAAHAEKHAREAAADGL